MSLFFCWRSRRGRRGKEKTDTDDCERERERESIQKTHTWRGALQPATQRPSDPAADLLISPPLLVREAGRGGRGGGGDRGSKSSPTPLSCQLKTIRPSDTTAAAAASQSVITMYALVRPKNLMGMDRTPLSCLRFKGFFSSHSSPKGRRHSLDFFFPSRQRATERAAAGKRRRNESWGRISSLSSQSQRIGHPRGH